jgi:site-specific recombinase XerD
MTRRVPPHGHSNGSSLPNTNRDPRTRAGRRYHLDGSVIQRNPAGSHRISEPASSHTSRHSSAAHLMEKAMMILTIQELLTRFELARRRGFCAEGVRL